MNYKYLTNFSDDNELIKSYFDFTRTVFDFDLQRWRDAGYWPKEYIPHSLIYNNRIIANISVSIMRLQIKGNNIPAVQLGSVGVLPDYRGKGLSRVLMEKVLEEYKNIPLIFLFSHHLDYYLKFGFKRINEIMPFINVSKADMSVEPLNITLESDHVKRLFCSKLQHSSIIDARGNPSIYWYHLMYVFSQDIYYIQEKDIIFLARYDNDTVSVYDILSEKSIMFDEIKDYILKDDTRQVRFYFTPDWLKINYDIARYDMDFMFVFGKFSEDINNFKFPFTAIT